MDELASRGRRLGAAFIDGLLFAIPYAMVKYGGGFVANLGGFILFLALFGYQCWLVTQQGQTIGKRQLGIRIVAAEDGSNPGFVRVVVLRTFVNSLIAIIPLYGLIDVCFIFRGDRRCVHDWIARTKVVTVAAGELAAPAAPGAGPAEAQPL